MKLLILARLRVVHPPSSSPSFEGACGRAPPKVARPAAILQAFLLAAALLTAFPQQGDLGAFQLTEYVKCFCLCSESALRDSTLPYAPCVIISVLIHPAFTRDRTVLPILARPNQSSNTTSVRNGSFTESASSYRRATSYEGQRRPQPYHS